MSCDIFILNGIEFGFYYNLGFKIEGYLIYRVRYFKVKMIFQNN